MQSAVLAIVNPSVFRPSVRLSVRPSHAGTESKGLKLRRSWGLHWKIAPWL